MAEDVSLHSFPSSHHLSLLIFLPSSHFLCIFSLFHNGGEEGPIREARPPLCSDSSALCDRGKAGLSRCLYLNTHTRTHTHACVRTQKHTLPAPDPACALSSSPLRAAFFFFSFWRSGTANDTQLSVLKTGGGDRGRREEEKTSGEQNKSGSLRRTSACPALRCILTRGVFFCSTSGLFFFFLFSVFREKKGGKKRRGIWSSHDIIRVNGLPW